MTSSQSYRGGGATLTRLSQNLISLDWKEIINSRDLKQGLDFNHSVAYFKSARKWREKMSSLHFLENCSQGFWALGGEVVTTVVSWLWGPGFDSNQYFKF